MNKYIRRTLLLLIFTAVSAAAYLFSSSHQNASPPPKPIILSPQTKTEKLIPAVLENKNSEANTNTKTSPPTATQKNTTTTPTPPTTTNQSPKEISETIPITIVISDTSYPIHALPNSTAYQVMDTLRQENKISFSTKNFSGLGYFVQEINGIKNSPSTGFYWTFYINNQEAKVGISNYTIKANDILTWKFENK
ncbi:MAG: DUF4430 domain-containing protein [Candidatus Magasanikbacteria bacterium]|nr:DUF4430 domain-containing protein [Candidatus Magasanikbacteria bacterium]